MGLRNLFLLSLVTLAAGQADLALVLQQLALQGGAGAGGLGLDLVNSGGVNTAVLQALALGGYQQQQFQPIDLVTAAAQGYFIYFPPCVDQLTGQVTQSGSAGVVTNFVPTIFGGYTIEPVAVCQCQGGQWTRCTSSAVNNILNIVKGLPNLSTLYAVVSNPSYRPVAEALIIQGPFTLFAPTNQAFAAALNATGLDPFKDSDVPTITTILQYHVLPLALSTPLLQTRAYETLEGEPIEVVTSAVTVSPVLGAEREITINGVASVNRILRNFQASNGIVHEIDAVLVPPSIGGAKPVLEIVAENAQLTVLTQIATSGFYPEVAAILASPAPKTLFAPNNLAFQRFLTAVGLTAPQVLRPTAEVQLIVNSVLKYHLAPQEYHAEDITVARQIATFLPTKILTLNLRLGSNPAALTVATAVNSANTLSETDGSDGVVYVIDAVLDPADACSATNPCNPGSVCVNGKCEAGTPSVGCLNDFACAAGQRCINNVCQTVIAPTQCSPAQPCPAGAFCILGTCVTV